MSKLGHSIATNTPQSFRWTLRLFTQDDCEVFLLQHLTPEYLHQLRSDPAKKTTLLAFTEQALIDEFHPRLNLRMVTYDYYSLRYPRDKL
jgi:hypothetical protein